MPGPHTPPALNTRYLSTTLLRQILHKVKLGAGLDFICRAGTSAQIDAGNGKIDDLDLLLSNETRFSIDNASEFVFHRLSFLLHVTYTLIQKEERRGFPRWYNRLGLKGHVVDNIFGGLTVRFREWSKANYLEWNVGHQLQW